MLTIWPLLTANRPDKKEEECGHLLENYDLSGGLMAIEDARGPEYPMSGAGPFLIGWSPSRMRGIKDAVVLVVDMSDFDQQQSFDEAFLFWQRQIVENPELWRNGFSLERLRLALRDFADRYGKSILESIKLIKIAG